MHSNSQILEAWIKGWALARETVSPLTYKDGFVVDVGWEQQLRRYVFPAVGVGYKRIAETVHEPWVFLKVCATPKEISALLPPRWSIQPPGFMMVCNQLMDIGVTNIPEGYTLSINDNISVPVIRILTHVK